MVAQQEHRNVTTKSPPPPYKISAPDQKAQNSVPNSQNHRHPGPAMNGQWYSELEQLETIRFSFHPEPSLPLPAQDWIASLSVECSDVPRLMREGFH
ncbi:hypothetical protein F5Y10DRAFT_259739 [Nemania abortiva]|nr:hypothetical protein F5Y10DRAFT_259739 [Nemania abortiva]